MRLGGAGCGVRHQGPFAIAEPRRSDAVSLRSARAALDAAQKTRGKVGVSGENGVGSGGSLAGNENKILVSAGITAVNACAEVTLPNSGQPRSTGLSESSRPESRTVGRRRTRRSQGPSEWRL